MSIRRDYVEREYRIVLDVYATPMQIRALRDELDTTPSPVSSACRSTPSRTLLSFWDCDAWHFQGI